MSKRANSGKCRRSSFSSEEDEKASKQDVTSSCEKVKRSHKRYAAEQENSGSSIIKDDAQSTRQIKKPHYRLPKAHAPDRKPVNETEDCTRRHTRPCNAEYYSSKAKHHISEKDNTVRRSKTSEKETSNPRSTDTPGRRPQKTERILEGRLDEKYLPRSPSKLTKVKDISLASDKQKVERHNPRKRHRTDESPRTENNSSAIEESSRHKRRELIKKMSQRYQKIEIRVKSQSTQGRTSTSSPTKQSSTTTKQTTSENSSKVLKNMISSPKSATSLSHKTARSSSQLQKRSLTPTLPQSFKIPKKDQLRSEDSSGDNSVSKNISYRTEISHTVDSTRKSKQETFVQHHSCLDVTPSGSSEGQDKKDKRSSLTHQLPAVCSTTSEVWYDQMQVVEELHLARTEKKLEVNVMQSYGELTSMDTDPPEEGARGTSCKQPCQQGLIVVLDTNILLTHLDYVKKIRSLGLGALGFPVVLIPWVVLQELDSLKRGKGLSGPVAHLASFAISHIYNSLKSHEPNFWGQSMQQAAENKDGLNAENNDDRVLQCCLQFQSLYPESALILCTNDKNLCSKALLSGVKAFSKNDLEAEALRSTHALDPVHNAETTVLPHTNVQTSPPQPHSPKRPSPSAGLRMQYDTQHSEGGESRTCDLSRCVSELEGSLKEVLSDVLEVEMREAFDNLWLDIVCIKPPWTLQDVLYCYSKHWIAVFGQIVPRKYHQLILNLTRFFTSGKTLSRASILTTLQEAKMFVSAFEHRSSHVPSAISALDRIFNKLQPQVSPPPRAAIAKKESPARDVPMSDDDDEDQQPTSAQVSHEEVWALFENIWSNTCQMSSEVFKVLGFDHTMQSAQPAGGPPPQEALACLHRLSSMVTQLLQAFSSVLSSAAPSLEQVQTVLSIIQSYKIGNLDSRLTAVDLLGCFSQSDYREKLRFGGTQLMGLKEALDRCVEATFTPGQDVCTAAEQMP